MMHAEHICVIGAGLAGCEAAWAAAELGVAVDLYEMKPSKYTPAHHFPGFAELVCSNSLRSADPANAVGLLKEELTILHSLMMEAAYASRVPAGSALAVDRVAFSEYISRKIRSHPGITVHEKEALAVPKDGITVIASGPLTTDALAEDIAGLLGGRMLSFYDAAAPIVDASSIDMGTAYFASRYGKGDPTDYLNCPMNREEYEAFYQALVSAETAPLKAFDRTAQESEPAVFEGCMPVEVMAGRGQDTLRYGPMKPVGLPMPQNGKEPYAVVQLRRENREGSMYNMVGFQTHLTFGEQRRVFRMIPGLQSAAFFRYGVMHRNTYIRSPGVLTPTYAMRAIPQLFFAGQMTGVEGYVESAASGYVAGINAARLACGAPPFVFPRTTEIGALAHYVSGWSGEDFQPMNANFGIIEPLPAKIKGGKQARNRAYAERSLSCIRELYCELSGNTDSGKDDT